MVLFFVLAFAISWGFWLAAAVLTIPINTPAGRLLETAGNFGPFLAAMVSVGITQGLPGIRRLVDRLLIWRVAPRWYMAALLGPFGVMLLAMAISAALVPSAVMSTARLTVLIPAFFHSLLLAGGLNEETGWRGYALPGMRSSMPAFRASLLLGVLWGLWHIPLYFVPGTGQYDMIQSGGSFIFLFTAFVVWAIGLSVIFTWLSEQTGGSLLIVILFHAAIDTAAGLPVALGIQTSLAAFLYPLLTWVIAITISRQKPFISGLATSV